MNDETFLYRVFSGEGELLYCGIAQSWVKRFAEHARDKAWWPEVTSVRLESLPTRAIALSAEEYAIKSEFPRYNVVHNKPRRPLLPMVPPKRPHVAEWTFGSRLTAYRRTIPLVLYPELDCSSVVDEAYSEDGESQLLFYLNYLDRNYPQWLKEDAVPIHWYVRGDSTLEAAPFDKSHLKTWRDIEERDQLPHVPATNFLSFFEWPYDSVTGDHLDWFKLPVKMDRFPEFSKALGWCPSALQPTAPLTSIMASRNGEYPPDQTFDRRLYR